MYVIHLVTTVGAITAGFFLNYSLFLMHIPFLIMTILGVILIPINRYNRFKQVALEGQLEDANRKIAQLAIIEERHRIARDLHDTLGQKLSMIGLKSELSIKLIEKNKEAAIHELHDVQQAARQALKEVREMVSDMRTIRISDEIEHITQLLKAANIELHIKLEADCEHIPLFVENVLSMCLREAVTNVVKHSNAENCYIKLSESNKSIQLKVGDDGKGISQKQGHGNGLQGMKERLEFVNGILDVERSEQGFTICIAVPKILKQIEEEEKL
ncbi:sensor histidine kinase [Gracilibacillus boraciitolerans JCM 21714]|uniref:histidine kinase n=2 Tax=Gracilibacillus boraciitolerans TaxID=307521 RepID=W4VP26_9BACI|nr:sensor histidine kinase [Gracilibacillus boraciitolerans JCM 21714]